MKGSKKSAALKKKPAAKRAAARALKKSAKKYEGPPLKIGSEFTLEAVVPHEWTIQAFNPALPAVLSTPRMIQLMEHATVRAIINQLPPGSISVGTRIEVDHLKAVSDGATVKAHARLAGFQGRFLVFDVDATAGDIVLGRGKVFRAVVEPGKHGDKARARVNGGAQ
jgi:fluoroacetyl-CoA thioesterase